MQQLILSVLLATFWTVCKGAGDWCYQSQFTCEHKCNTPDKWEHAHSDCAGKYQSPINIVTRKTLKDERLTPLQFSNYQEIFRSTVKNNGHSIQVGVPHHSTISGGNLKAVYKAVQFHLHWGSNGGPGSEHTLDGEQYPMEAMQQAAQSKQDLLDIRGYCESTKPSLHIVHMKQHYTDLKTALSDPEGIAVLGFFYERSNSANRKYEVIIKSLESIEATGSNTTLSPISLEQLIPPQQNLTNYYRYKGSLTTPGCTQNVIWTVFENPIPLSTDQLSAFSEVKFHDGKPMVGNYRPVQPLNGRQVFRSGSAAILASYALLVTTIITALGLSQLN